jgi:5-carboxymethyl-2-hydroxymuconate isomerase
MTKFLDFYLNLDCSFTDDEKTSCLPLIYEITEIFRRTYVESQSPYYQTWQQAADKEQDPFFKTALTLIANRPIDNETELSAYVEQAEETLLKRILANQQGQDLLSKTIILHGISCILRGRSRHLTAYSLYAILGEKYLAQAIEAPSEFGNPSPVYTINSVQDYLAIMRNRSENITLSNDYKNAGTSGKLDYLFHYMDSIAVQTFLKEISPYDLSIVMKGGDCHYGTYEKILCNVSTRMGESIIIDLEYTKAPELGEIEKAKSRFVQVIQRLMSEGIIEIGKIKPKIIKFKGDCHD